ncbi:MAG: ATP-binding cassette domain-containing protein [Nitrosomonas sp.]|nr:ATP-binding cassette domain-containing protein [Nitrosomonas sp.]
MITTANITMQFGAKPLFENVSVKFGGGNRYGLIGANGCGKSTFMKILGRDLEPTAGNVTVDSGERVGKLRQDQFAFEDCLVIDTVLMGHAELWQVKQERDAIYANPDATEEEYMHAAELESQFAELDGYSAEARAGELLLGVGIPSAQHQGLMSAIAPGFKLRVLLAQALFSNPEILLLDEPTNNLDINTIRWLEDVINASKNTIIIISHDRHFLNSVCTHMADLDYGELRIYPGKKARQATSRARQIEKIKLEDVKPSSRQYPFIRFEVDDRDKLHRLAVSIKEISKRFPGMDKPLFDHLSFDIEAGEKIAIIGPNGIGKTTLLRCLTGELIPESGTIKWPDKARPGYYAQDHAADFEETLSLTEWMDQWRQGNDDDQTIRGTLGRLLFSGDDVKKSTRVISGGEQGRMLFGKLILQKPNVLLMDEPTNHLDMESIESLNSALEKYTGTLIFISHDREFVSSLATRILEMKPEGINDFKGNYEDYLQSQGIE